jgi:hypothetical protein
MPKGRGAKNYKGYVAVFICLVTKAAHLEVVSHLTTDAYKRFTARRGNCVQLYSDNGRNFVETANKLDKGLKLAIREATEEVAKLIEDDGTT